MLHATDSTSMLSALKLVLSARPASNLLFSPESDDHPLKVAIKVVCDLYFHYAPRLLSRELLRLIIFLMTPVGGASILSDSVCSFSRSTFELQWSLMLRHISTSASLSLPLVVDPENVLLQDAVANCVERCDLLWSLLVSPVPHLLPSLFAEPSTLETCLFFLARMMQLVSRDGQQFDATIHVFKADTIESLLASLHALLKLFPLRDRIGESYFKLMGSCGLDPAVTTTQLWNERATFEKLVHAATPDLLDDQYGGGDYIRVAGALFHGTIGLLMSRNCSKDTTHSAGLLAASLASDIFLSVGKHSPAWTQAQLIHTFLPSLATNPSLIMFSVLNTLPTQPHLDASTTHSTNATQYQHTIPHHKSTQELQQNPGFQKYIFSQAFLDTMPQPALLSLIRGLVIGFNSNIGLLSAPCAALPGIRFSNAQPIAVSPHDSMVTHSSSHQIEASSIIFDAILPWFLRFSETSCERYARFLAVKSAGSCVEFIIKSFDTIQDAESKPTTMSSGNGGAETIAVSSTVKDFLKQKVEVAMDRLFELIWKNWEDPFDSIVSEICNIFPMLLDAGEGAYKVFGQSASLGPDFIDKLASHLLNIDIGTRGKYPLLTLLIQRVGPARLLELKPDFVQDLFDASNYFVAGRAIAPVISVFLTSIHKLLSGTHSSSSSGKKSSSKKASGTKTEISNSPSSSTSTWSVDPSKLLTKPLIGALLEEETLAPMSLYALPTIFELWPDFFTTVLRLLTTSSPSSDSNEPLLHFDKIHVKAILSVLKVARSSGLIENTSLSNPRFVSADSDVHENLLSQIVSEALVSEDIECRLDAMHFLVETRKVSELPTSLELESLLRNVDFNMLETSLVYRNRSMNLLDQILLRFKDSIKHHYKLPARSLDTQQIAVRDVRNAVSFLNDFSRTLLYCLYSPAPPHRRFTALEGLKSLVSKFGPEPTKGSNFVPYLDLAYSEEAISATSQVSASQESQKWKQLEMFSPAATLSLLAGLWDQYDAARVLSFEVLKAYPSPLPGFETQKALEPLMRWALSSLCSPRMREADSGSLALRLIASSYIFRSGWSIRMAMHHNSESKTYTPSIEAHPPPSTDSNSLASTSNIERMCNFCNDILDIVLVHVAETRRSRQVASMHFPVHGPLMAVRYIINDVNTSALDETSSKHWRRLVERMLSVGKTVSSLALELKYPLRYTHNEHGEVDHSRDHQMDDDNGDGDEDADSMAMMGATATTTQSDDSSFSSTPASSNAKKNPEAKDSNLIGGTTEGVLVAMWLSLKEVAFLFGCLVKSCVSSAQSDQSKISTSSSPSTDISASFSSGTNSGSLRLNFLSADEIRSIGQHLLDTLLVLRHRGAMETTGEGFQLICESLLTTTDRILHSIVHDWLAQLLNRIDNTPWALLSTRRSAGLPYAFLAVLRSETIAAERARTSRSMLPLVISHLITTASRQVWISQPALTSEGVQRMAAERDEDSVSLPSSSDPSHTSQDADVGKGRESNHSPKEHRHQVHAFNVIRAIIRDRNVIHDISPYVEPVLTLVLKLYASPHWAVQNSATMAFSTLLERTAGGSRLANTFSAATDFAPLPPSVAGQPPRAKTHKFTAVSFFARYPIAHAFLVSSLASSTPTYGAPSSSPATSKSESKAKFDQSLPNDASAHLINKAFKGVIETGLIPPFSELTRIISELTKSQSHASTTVSPSDTGDGNEVKGEIEQEEEKSSSSLYAVLLLLSRMSPSKTTSSQQQSHVSPFILLTCSAALSNRNAMVRALAAKALAPLIATPVMSQYVESMIHCLPNSHKDLIRDFRLNGEEKGEDTVSAASLAVGAANQIHGLLTVILQLLRTHVHILVTGSQTTLHLSENEKDEISGTSSSPSEGSFSATCIAQLSLLRNHVLPLLQTKLWLLQSKVAPIAAVLLDILKEFVIQPLCASPSLVALHPNLSSLASTVISISSLQLKRRAVAGVTSSQSSTSDTLRAVMDDVMVHQQYQAYAHILSTSLLQLHEHMNLNKAQIGDTTQSSLEALMAFPLYEVRLLLYKLVSKHIASPHIAQKTLAKRLLQSLGFLPVATPNAFLETHPKCTLRIIRLLNSLGEKGMLTSLLTQGQEEIDTEKVFSVLQRWSAYNPDVESMGTPISRYCKTNTLKETVDETGVSTSLRQESLAFMAFFLRSVQPPVADAPANVSKYLPMLTWWLQTIEKHSSYELGSTDRAAAILSLSRHPLHFSSLPSLDSFRILVVDYWMLVLRQLQDDEEHIREDARRVVSRLYADQRYAVLSRPENSAHHHLDFDLEPGLMVCTQFCYSYLTKIVPTLAHYWQWLFLGLCPKFGHDMDAPVLEASVLDLWWAKKLSFSTQLFEQEKANFFHEPALIAQLCRAQLLQISKDHPELLHHSTSEEIITLVRVHKEETERNLLSVITFLIQRKSDPNSVIVSNLTVEWQFMYDQIFTPIYSMLIALETISNLAPTTLSLHDSVRDAVQNINQGMAGILHPAIAGLIGRICTQQREGAAGGANVTFSSASPYVVGEDSAAASISTSKEATTAKKKTIPTPAETWATLVPNCVDSTNFLIPRRFTSAH